MNVAERDRETYEADGVVCVRGVIEPEWIEVLQAAVDEALDAPSELATDYALPGQGRFFGDYNMWKRLKGFRNFEFGSRAPEVAAKLMGSKQVQLYTEHLLVKEPGTDAALTPWHQDAPYSKVIGDQFGALWIAIDPVTASTGAMEFIAGSHRWDQDFGTPDFEQKEEPAAPESDIIEQEISRRNGRRVSYELAPGDCTFHHCRTLHRAGGNTSSTVRRRGLSVRFIGDDVCWAGQAAEDGESQFIRLNSDLRLPAGAKLPEDRFPILWGSAVPA